MNDMTKKINKLEAMVDEDLTQVPLIPASELRNDIRKFRLIIFTFVTASYLAFLLLTYENLSLLGKHTQNYFISTYSGHVYSLDTCDKDACSAINMNKE